MIGHTISHYKILEKLGGGGMGVVYKARDLKLDRIVALKFLPPDLTRDTEAKERFVHEAKVASSLDHPNICNVHEIGESNDGQIFIVMSSYEGETLKKKIERGSMPVKEALDYAMQVARGLSKAHEKGIIHRDIKPANILITTDGVAKIVDFGLAKLSGRTLLTKSGTTLGTAAYMSPEQARGEQVDQRTDLWSLGVVVYEMLASKRPFESGYEQAMIYSILNDEPKPLRSMRPEIPETLESIVEHALNKSIEERYQHAEEMVRDLQSLQAGTRGVIRRSWIISAKAQRWVAAGALLALLLIAAVALIFWPRSHTYTRLAILPFIDTARDSTLEYLFDGLTEDVINNVSTTAHSISVISFNGVLPYKGKPLAVAKVGEELGVDVIAVCRVYRTGDEYQLKLELLDAKNNSHIDSRAFHASLADFILLPQNMCPPIMQALGVRILSDTARAGERQQTRNIEAYRYYLKANSLYHRLSAQELREAIIWHKKALEIDQAYAQPYAGISICYRELADMGFVPLQQIKDSAINAAIKAIELDNNLPEAHLALAAIKHLSMERKEAVKEYQRAIELNPSYADAIHHYAHILAEGRHFDEGIQRMHQSIQLEPLSVHYQMCLGIVYQLASRYDEALSAYRRAQEMDSTFQRSLILDNIALCFSFKNDYQKTMEYVGLEWKERDILEEYPYLLDWYKALIAAQQGRKSEALRVIGKLKEFNKGPKVRPMEFALLYATLNEKEETLRWLEKAREAGSPVLQNANTWHVYDFLRDDPRFKAWLVKAGFED